MDIVDGRPSSSRIGTQKQQNKAGDISQENVSPAVRDTGKPFDKNCIDIFHQDVKEDFEEQLKQEKVEDDLPTLSDKGNQLDEDTNSDVSHQGQKQDYGKQRDQEDEEDILPTIDNLGEPLEDEEPSLFQKIIDLLPFSKNDKKLDSEHGEEINTDVTHDRNGERDVHDKDKEDVLPSIIDIGKPIEDQSNVQKAMKWFEEIISDVPDRPPAPGKNDLQNVDKQQDRIAGSCIDVVDGKVKKGKTKNGIYYHKKLRSQRKDEKNVITTHTTFQPQINEKPVFQRLKEWLKTKRDDEVDFKPQTKFPPENCYDMSCLPRGVFTLINVSDFVFGKDWKRKGTEQDAKDLTDLFLELGFMVERFDNPSRSFVHAIMDKIATADYSKKSCCACAILSHGDNGVIYGKDGVVSIDEMLKKFESKQLKGVPKFFIIQACRGGIYMNQMKKVEESEKPEEPEYVLSLPGDADFLCAYSTPPGYYSWRRENSSDAENIGSWFVKALVEVFRADAHKLDVVTMLTRVNEQVANRFSNVPGKEKAHEKKGIPSFQCQLTKDLILYPPFGPK